MRESEMVRDAGEARAVPEPQEERPAGRRGPRDETPLLVEVAWLVIEAATAVARLRRILARL